MTDSAGMRLTKACDELTGLLDRLEEELPHKAREGFTAGGSPSKGGHRPLAAWNTPVAMLLLEIHAGVRKLEASLQREVTGRARPRGGATTVTVALVQALPALAAGADKWAARETARQVEAWCWKSKLALGEKEPWQRLPRAPGEAEPRCPFCTFTTLRYKPYTGRVRCLNPDCKDSDGNAPSGLLEVGELSGEPQLAWNDGSTGIRQ